MLTLEVASGRTSRRGKTGQAAKQPEERLVMRASSRVQETRDPSVSDGRDPDRIPKPPQKEP